MLNKNIIGIDIYDDRLTVVRLHGDGSVVALGTQTLEQGIVVDGVIVKCDAFSSACEMLLKKTQPEPILDGFLKPFAHVSLPMQKVFSYSIEIPKTVAEKDRRAYVEHESAKIIPVEFGRLYVNEYIGTVRGKTIATLVGAERELVDSYKMCLANAGVEVVFIGSRLHAIARALLPVEFNGEHYLLLHISSSGTTVGIFDEHAIAFATIESFVSTQDIVAAAESKQATVLTDLATEMRGLQHYYAHKTGQQITHVILTGNIVATTALHRYIEEHFELPVTIGDPTIHLQQTALLKKDEASEQYTSAIGLALYGIRHSLPAINIVSTQYKPSMFMHHSLRIDQFIPENVMQHIERMKAIAFRVRDTRIIMAASMTGVALCVLVYVLIMYV